ncbi:hypothetical protein Nepgr_020494 [Nepenthes gracilis]|uniref:Secreted protein n=1 Tax=Nepenthes gracilis TaxID=150966 RepID=A0AAD3SW71_NEPGR|nr:hypothetical protein Nepgr_020494 [Nepenthes gracilis]
MLIAVFVCCNLLDCFSCLSARLFRAVVAKALSRRLLAWCSSFVRGCHHSSCVWRARSGEANAIAKPLEPQQGSARLSGHGNRTPGSRTRSCMIARGVSPLPRRYNHQVEVLAHDHRRLRVLSFVREGPFDEIPSLSSAELNLWVAARAYRHEAIMCKAIPRPSGVGMESWDDRF